MASLPDPVAQFLAGRRFAVAGVSRRPQQAANAILRKLRQAGYDAIPVNPNAAELEGTACYASVAAIPGSLDGVVIATHPAAALQVVRDCAQRGVGRVWFHRSFGMGSVADDAIAEARAQGMTCLVGGCPLMYCEPVDVFHRCIRGSLGWRRRLPA
jgi:predicted CoA-binding protein